MTTFGLAVYDDVAHFNIGNFATLLIFDKVNIERGYYTTLGCITENNCRIQNAKRQSSDSAKTRRRYLRGQKKDRSDNTHKTEGDNTHKIEGKIYSAGNF